MLAVQFLLLANYLDIFKSRWSTLIYCDTRIVPDHLALASV